MTNLDILQVYIQKIKVLLLLPYLLLLQVGEIFLSLGRAKIRLHNYAFSQGFILVVQKHNKKRDTILFNCSYYGKKAQDIRKLVDVLHKQSNTLKAFLDYNFQFCLSPSTAPTSMQI